MKILNECFGFRYIFTKIKKNGSREIVIDVNMLFMPPPYKDIHSTYMFQDIKFKIRQIRRKKDKNKNVSGQQIQKEIFPGSRASN